MCGETPLLGLPPVHLTLVVGSSPPIELLPDPGRVSAARAHRIIVALVGVRAVGGGPRSAVTGQLQQEAAAIRAVRDGYSAFYTKRAENAATIRRSIGISLMHLVGGQIMFRNRAGDGENGGRGVVRDTTTGQHPGGAAEGRRAYF